MSHWTSIKTKIGDLEALKSALDRMGLIFEEGDFTISQYKTKAQAQLRLDTAVGFARQQDGTFAMVGDFYHSSNPLLSKYYSNTKQFQADIATAYGIEEGIARLSEQQFTCIENEEGTVDEDGLIHMTFERL